MTNKEFRKKTALRHHEYMSDAFSEETKTTVARSKIFENGVVKEFSTLLNSQLPFIEVKNLTSDEAVWYMVGDCCVLNFASFTRPGGGFINGSMAQEEALCHASNLYEVLVNFKDRYDDNYHSNMNHGVYKNWAIYSPDIIFIDEENKPSERIISADVITCAAPNKKAATEVKNEYFDMCLNSRIKFILDVCEQNRVKKLILGAFGCGVFGNDPETVADMFMHHLVSGRYSFQEVLFAIPANTKRENYDAFNKIVKKYGIKN